MRQVLCAWAQQGLLKRHAGKLCLPYLAPKLPLVVPASCQHLRLPVHMPKVMPEARMARLPVAPACQHVQLVTTVQAAFDAVQQIADTLQQSVAQPDSPGIDHMVGLDTETRPNTKAGLPQNHPALLQVCFCVFRASIHQSATLLMQCSCFVCGLGTAGKSCPESLGVLHHVSSATATHNAGCTWRSSLAVSDCRNTRKLFSSPGEAPHRMSSYALRGSLDNFAWLSELMLLPNAVFCGVGLAQDIMQLHRWFFGYGGFCSPNDHECSNIRE